MGKKISDLGREKLLERADRLTRLLAMNAPLVMVANEVKSIETALWLADPDAMSMAVKMTQVAAARRHMNVCQFCDSAEYLPDSQGMCATCLKECVEEASRDDALNAEPHLHLVDDES